jgi:hypothetical protein
MGKAATIIIDGTEYISSVRAAELVGYTKDYVGQLARAGKIESMQVGRSWYILEDSIRKHKLSSHYTLTKPKKTHNNEKRSNKITNKNIDKSSNKSISQKEDVDLIPRLIPKKKRQSDLLLHMDISYQNNSTEFQKNNKKKTTSVSQNKHNDGFKMVAIRKPSNRLRGNQRNISKMTRVHRKSVGNNKSVRIDGIVKKKYKKRTTLKEVTNINHEKVFEEKQKPKNGDTKIFISIILIIFFTVFAVAYIFLFL